MRSMKEGKIVVLKRDAGNSRCPCFRMNCAVIKDNAAFEDRLDALKDGDRVSVLIYRVGKVTIEHITEFIKIQKNYGRCQLIFCASRISPEHKRLLDELFVRNYAQHDTYCVEECEVYELGRSAVSCLIGSNDTLNPITKRLVDLFLNNIREANLQRFASTLRISPDHASRVFKKNCGRNFREFVGEVRFHIAKRLLCQPNARIADIATRLGYEEVNNFSRFFRNKAGVSPRRFALSCNCCQESESALNA